MGFKKGDILEYCGELFEVLKNYGNSGSVIHVNDDFERLEDVPNNNFYWSAYGADCKLIEACA